MAGKVAIGTASGITVAMRHCYKWFIHLWAKVPSYTPHQVWHYSLSLPRKQLVVII